MALEADDLSKRFGRRRWALRDVTLKIPQGGITALVGPNAAGKSTLIKTWIGFERPTSGSVRIVGADPSTDHAKAVRHAAYVPQFPGLYRALTIEDHLLMAERLRPGFDRALARKRLEDLDVSLSAHPDELSGGQQAQVSLAVALGTHASVMLLDEPLAALDPLARRNFLHVVTESVRAEGASALLSSHIVTDVEQACDAIIVLAAGRVLLHAAIADALEAHTIAGSGTSAGPIVGTFISPTGESLDLIRDAANPAGVDRRAELEELVLGYLASSTAGAPAPQQAA